MLILLRLLWLAAPTYCLWPSPSGPIANGSDALFLSSNFHVVLSSLTSLPPDLIDAIKDAQGQIDNDDFERLTLEDDREKLRDARTVARMTLELDPHRTQQESQIRSITDDVNLDFAQWAENEAYRLRISERSCVLSASTSLGFLRGLQTFVQLVYTLPLDPAAVIDDQTVLASAKRTRYILNTPIDISDKPAFPVRGLMVDTSRAFLPVDALQRLLDAMSWSKFSLLHWHMTDAQSWPLEVTGYPELLQAAYNSQSIYKASKVDELVAFANARGIQVMLEIDMPGHTASIGLSHPDHVACHDAMPWQAYSVEPPAGQLRIASDTTTAFARGIVQSVARRFAGSLFSTGGDEVNTNCYAEDAATQQALSARNSTLMDALSAFVSQLQDAVAGAGKRPVVWEEMVLDHNIALRNDTVVTVWQTSENVRKVAQKGFQIIHAASDYFYLDCGMGAWLDNMPNGTSWCDPYKTWQRMLSFDPYAALQSRQRHLVLGGQALLWSEQTDETNFEQNIWPRAAAIAERFWYHNPNDDTTLSRLHEWRYRLVKRGIRAVPLQPHLCVLRPGLCSL
ncbi:glycoside hydrolase family 20 protein [Mixia osmundae IAM 14324]|uniref:glycoside hydrolase family 20 protein n=1 Tax=Mixia osmundae (strain CBS 9802 / IAM 14324 / JCM 22182 / KY 12970) TaxID=764103 RepID=UPI0004A550BB|nr:glycoside hydrolase family 20 protein [Mixia osmundae IAM 14324]XP_014566705.1 glycoside hydrolase family 20 protein [Mixia osmundae IAM 14324]KEI36174.1 glycoside hydrolase family 20 protein [Mixia osmundae IAM 14324]KEI38142.1 glycoside hydrolase family 20 protein [Mixia osmundae IAM 14324]